MICILCPSRGRPQEFMRMMDSAYNTAAIHSPKAFDLLAYVADEDKSKSQYGVVMMRFGTLYSGPDYPTAHKWNLLAEEALKNSENKLFMLGADDMVFETPGWDKALLDHYNALENKIHVYALQDSRDPNGTPHPIVTREYIDAMGYFIPPIFMHWFIDTWTIDIARSNGCFTHFKDFSLQHIKPSDEGKPDETHSRIRQWGWHERDRWVAEKCKDFLELEKRKLGEELGLL